jgi:hypothetical protein
MTSSKETLSIDSAYAELMLGKTLYSHHYFCRRRPFRSGIAGNSSKVLFPAGPLLDGVLEALQDQDPRDVTESLRELVHARNRKAAANTIKKQMKRRHHSGADQWGKLLKARQLAAGNCLEPTCPSCGTGTLFESFDRLCGIASKCSDRTCKDPTNCSTCRRQIQELEDAFIQRMR